MGCSPFFKKPIDASAMLDKSYLSELRPCGCCDDDAGKTTSKRRPNRQGFSELVKKVKGKIKWWLRDRDLEKWNSFVDSVISTRKQKERPIRRSPMTIRFARGTRLQTTQPSMGGAE
ncbi:unnamed protein product [Clonostachys rosea]|uniref:Uncharacterized protein n=1 Tax=Bionectria ochroleuca TaxID=29856 RepID=A0ABY6UIH8_BIOOC|nr:unnamed protein product [Clonostachys rosea]